jgi:ERCC4-related helicase
MEPGDRVRHRSLGAGDVILDRGETVIVDFRGRIESCARPDLSRLLTPVQAAAEPEWDSPLRVITRCQAEAIQSTNDAWGVFSRSRIALLPHQLWVCKKVSESWPTHWLVADDVGLGKTIEAGLILWPLLARGRVRRFLLVCPASLVQQWEHRLRTMFDIRTTPYVPELDTSRGDFWNSHHQVVASLQTLRADRGGRRQRLLEAEPWDLLLVDEAHHLNADEDRGPTLGFTLVRELVERQQVQSAVFFTGTPHRGKDHGFLSLMSLLRPDLFDPAEPIGSQLLALGRAMIRNNKQQATDMQGNRLFQPPNVTPETYSYSPAEERFYQMLTEFIVSGRAYASGLSQSDRRMVTLILIAMQKIASSSVAAIRRALRRRLERLESASVKSAKTLSEEQKGVEDYDKLGADDEDVRNARDEMVASAALQLMRDEEPRLRDLLAAADAVTEETRVTRIMEILDSHFAGRSVLMFTEYKATQSLLLSELHLRFGDGCAAFINGDEAAEDVEFVDGTVKTVRMRREEAAELFNNGEVRFLISTEAGGEGIDLQERCHSLIHVDLPWNPMRLHQRVGRLNRYGQTERVDVVHLRNPDTVEGRIWDKLLTKIDSIQAAFDPVMDEPEDLLQLVLGMTSPEMFREIFAEADDVSPERFDSWWDAKTARIGGKDSVQAVRDLVGNAARFDYQDASNELPRVGLPALEPFFRTMLALNGRQVRDEDGGMSFKTPDSWRQQVGVRMEYTGLHFNREVKGKDAIDRIAGVGHKAVDLALRDALESDASIASVPSSALSLPLFVFSIADSVTTGSALVRTTIVGVEGGDGRRVLRDWELLERLNAVADARGFRRATSSLPAATADRFATLAAEATRLLERDLASLQLSYTMPISTLVAALWPLEERVAT